MRNEQDLRKILGAIDGRGYSSYREIQGHYDLGDFELIVDHTQVDPYAPPSRMRVFVPLSVTGIAPELVRDRLAQVATGDFLTRTFAAGAHGSRDFEIARPGQEILERTSVIADGDGVEARFTLRLPAAGRRIRGREATGLLLTELGKIVRGSLMASAIDVRALQAQVTYLHERAELLEAMQERGIVAFVADGSVLPRRSGDSDLPLETGAREFRAPDSLREKFVLSSGRELTGLAIKRGITVIVGGGYHGKSTLLRAMERGVYPHIAGDGREWVVSDESAVSVRAEDGRSVANVDISPFIGVLPSGKTTSNFTTTNASGSTSQATNVMEALEAGARVLLIDEDTSATNFMIRDRLMRELIPAEREPITPLIDRIGALRSELGVSTVIVAGGSSAFLALADCVIAMDSYEPEDATARAHQLVGRVGDGEDAGHGDGAAGLVASGAGATATGAGAVFAAALEHKRAVDGGSLNPREKTKPAKAAGRDEIRYGKQSIDLWALAQLVDTAQTHAIAEALEGIAQEADGRLSARELADRVLAWIDESGLDALAPRGRFPGNLARPRRAELLAALNRLRLLRIG